MKPSLKKALAATVVPLLLAAYALAQAPQSVDTSQPPQNKSTYVVLSCNDGDTCRIRNSDNITLKVRLAGIDAPEFAKRKGKKKAEGQNHAEESKKFLNELVKGKNVTLNPIGTDAYNRTIAEVFVDNANVNLQLVEKGYVEVYKGKPPAGLNIEAYRAAEDAAKKEKRGIWADAGYESPYDFRKRTRSD